MDKELLDIARIKDPDKLHTSIIEFCKLYSVDVKLFSEYNIDYTEGIMKTYEKSIEINDLIQHDRILGDQGFSYESKFKRIILKIKINNTKREYSIFLKQ